MNVLHDTRPLLKNKGATQVVEEEIDIKEYLFFDESLAKRFQELCGGMGLKGEIQKGLTHLDDDTYTVLVKDFMSLNASLQLEELYSDILFGEQAALIEGNSDKGALADACGVQVQLESGDFTTVAIHPEIMNKILSVLSIDELQAFLSQVAEDVENPKSGPICARKDLPTI